MVWESGEPETTLAFVRRVPDIAMLDAGLLNTSEDTLTAAFVAFLLPPSTQLGSCEIRPRKQRS